MEPTYNRVHFKNILFATDFSPASETALEYGLALARRYGSHLFVAHIARPVLTAVAAAGMSSAMADVDTEAIEGLAKLEPQLRDIPHEFLIRRGDIWKEIAAITEEKAITLLVVGTHGRSGASKWVMGSVAEEIFRKAPCPVLTVGPHVCGEPEAFAKIAACSVPKR